MTALRPIEYMILKAGLDHATLTVQEWAAIIEQSDWLAGVVANAKAEQREADAQIALTTTSAPMHTPWGQFVAHRIRTEGRA